MQPNRSARLPRNPKSQGQRSEARSTLRLVRLWIGIPAVRRGEEKGETLRDSVSLGHSTTASQPVSAGKAQGQADDRYNACLTLCLAPLLRNDVCRDAPAPYRIEPTIAGRSIGASDRRPQHGAVREGWCGGLGFRNHLTALG